MPRTEVGPLRQAIQDLYYWQRRDATDFKSLIYTLISKADIVNRAKLAGAFPLEYNAYILWHDSPDEDEFFKDWLGGDIMRLRSR